MSPIKVGFKTGYGLRFPVFDPLRELSNEWYKKTKAGRLVGLDRESGGYPFAARLFRDVKIWDRAEDALSYGDFFPESNFDLVMISIDVKLNWND